MSQTSGWMLYGANGYTGRSIAAAAVRAGMRPVLAGRNAEAIESLARDLDCPARVFSLGSTAQIARHLDGVSAVLHCAGPFALTAAPMMEACVDQGVHYLDITGEIEVIERAGRMHEAAKTARIVLMPAVGMDVVPSDCLAARLAQALPGAVRLQLAFTADWALSHGTAATVWMHLGHGGRVRRDGQIVAVPTAWRVMEIPFRRGPRRAMTIPWGDVASAYHTTGVPNIEVYAAIPPSRLRLARALGWLVPLARIGWIQAAGRRWIDRHVRASVEAEQGTGRTEFWGRATDDQGRTAEAAVETPNGYRLTVATSLAILKRILEEPTGCGFQTPAQAFGPELLDQLPEVAFHWITRP